MSLLLEEHLCCPVCRDIFRDPVLLSCSHSFCQKCLQTWWVDKPIHPCPLCKSSSLEAKPPCNLVLKNLCEAFLSGKDQIPSADVCSLHFERLKLFCLNHRQPVCPICRDSKIHAGHLVRPISEVKPMEERLAFRDDLDKKIKEIQEAKTNCEQEEEHIKVKEQQIEKYLKNQFQQLHNFLDFDESIRVHEMRMEVDQNREMLRDKIKLLNRRKIYTDALKLVEEDLKAGNLTSLKHQELMRSCPSLDEKQLAPKVHIEEFKHLGELPSITCSRYNYGLASSL